jgi:phospholipid/cholesterol/gamma-HCH transport system substrate-binding protein
MATGTNHYKLGLFVILGLVLALGLLVVLGASNWSEKTVEYVSYLDESVQGLELGSPVKFRGVAIGRVARIDIAPDMRHVEITSALSVSRLQRLNLQSGGEGTLSMRPRLRVQLAQTGITGVKFVSVDYLDGPDQPPLELPFPVPPNHLPAAPSTLKNLESTVLETADRFPEMAADLAASLAALRTILGQVEQQRLPEQVGATLAQVSQNLTQVSSEVSGLRAEELSRSVQQSLASFDQTLLRVNRLMERFEGERGVLARAEHTLEALGDVATGGKAIAPELELTLRELRSTSRSIRRFADMLERDPDMLLKGRAEK